MNIQYAESGRRGAPSKELVAFARRQWVNSTLYKGDQRRQEKRFPMTLPVVGVALDEDFQVTGEPIGMITRDVAANSIGLIHEDPMTQKWLAIHLVLAGAVLDLVVELKWNESMGPFYGSGGIYVKKLKEFPCLLEV